MGYASDAALKEVIEAAKEVYLDLKDRDYYKNARDRVKPFILTDRIGQKIIASREEQDFKELSALRAKSDVQ